jgi:hypothetical protein
MTAVVDVPVTPASPYHVDAAVIWLMGGAAIAGTLLPLTVMFAGIQNSDGIIPALMSTQKLTWYFWGQDRLLSLLPAVTSGITDVEWNLRLQIFLRAAAAWMAPLGLLVFLDRSPPFLALASALTNAILIACCRESALSNIYVYPNMFCTSLALLSVGYLVFSSRVPATARLLSALLICTIAYACNLALLIYSIPLLSVLAILRQSERRSLTIFLFINVAAVAAAKLHSAFFGEPVTTYALAFSFDSLLTGFRSVWAQLRPLPLLGICALTLLARRFDTHVRPVELMAVLLLAMGMIAFTACTVWVQANEFNDRYFATFEIIIAGLIAGVLTRAILALKVRYAGPSGVAACLAFAIVALGGFDSGYGQIIGQPWRQGSKLVAAAMLEEGARVIIGDYWTAWPVIYESEQVRGERGVHRERIYAAADRGQALRAEFLRDTANSQQLAFCSLNRFDACKRRLLQTFGTEWPFGLTTEPPQVTDIGGIRGLKFWFTVDPGRIDMSAMFKQVGTIADDMASAREPADAAGFLLFGPYLRLPAGSYRLYVTLTCADNQAADTTSVTALPTVRVLGSVRLDPGDGRCDGNPHVIDIPFRLSITTDAVQFTTVFGGSGTLSVSGLRLSR